MPKISVIIPVYKVEQFLEDCVKSLLSQTFTDFEIILVDDGSPDNSGALCDKYAASDSRIKVFHKENGGVSSARNKGIEIAEGEWICFVDSDDWVEPDYLEVMYQTALENKADVSVCGFVGGKKTALKTFDGTSACVSVFSQKGFGGYSPLKLIRSGILKSGESVRYNENYRYLEDSEFFLRVFKKCSKVVWNNHPLYHYRENTASVTQQKRNMEIVNHAFDVMKKILETETDRRIINAVRMEYLNFEFGLVLADYRSGEFSSDFSSWLSHIKKNVFRILFNGGVKAKRKLAVLVMVICPKLLARM
ncbi:MAG: glycosyltransferase family 2 protein [Treponema sp.]|nr:glycosyltransferase family 2 protein [Treponema sp.]